MKLISASVGVFLATLCLTNGQLSADEWKPRHDLVSHTGVMNLNGAAAAQRGLLFRTRFLV